MRHVVSPAVTSRQLDFPKRCFITHFLKRAGLFSFTGLEIHCCLTCRELPRAQGLYISKLLQCNGREHCCILQCVIYSMTDVVSAALCFTVLLLTQTRSWVGGICPVVLLAVNRPRLQVDTHLVASHIRSDSAKVRQEQQVNKNWSGMLVRTVSVWWEHSWLFQLSGGHMWHHFKAGPCAFGWQVYHNKLETCTSSADLNVAGTEP